MTRFSLRLTIVHTMSELKMMGNCLKGSRPILSFDKAFDASPELAVLKELFTHVCRRLSVMCRSICTCVCVSACLLCVLRFQLQGQCRALIHAHLVYYIQLFGTPLGHPRSKPFVDHIISFYVVDGKIWFRHYQVCRSHRFDL